MKLENLYENIHAGCRLSKEEGVFLLQNAELLDLGNLANNIRFRHNPREYVTYIVDTNPNYTNVCTVDCIFCAFYRRPGEEGAYTYTIDEMIEKIKASVEKGAKTILLQGGVNPELPFQYYIDLVRRTVSEVPEAYPHYFSTSEIIGMAEVSGYSTERVLRELWEAGLRSIPGGGAEILSDRVKKKISSKKGTSIDWIEVMRIAHEIGYKSTATMMYGHLEGDEDIVIHLDTIRELQDKTNGFTAFIPWSFKPGNTPLEKIIPHYASSNRYLRMIAFSRIYLDNFTHIQASWFSEGKKTGQIALHFGADDFGGTLLEEHVHAAANFVNKSNIDECRDMIRSAGFIPAERTTLYEILHVDVRGEVA